MTHSVLTIIGPTASGKTRAAVAVAKRKKGVIVSADSRQMYRELTVGAGKEGEVGTRTIRGVGQVPTRTIEGIEQVGVDLWSVKEEISVAQYVERVVPIIEGLLVEKRLPIIVGGSGLYVAGLLGLRSFAQVKPNKNRRLELERWTTEQLTSHLTTLAPEVIAQIDQKNRRRLFRAIEIAESGKERPPHPKESHWPVRIVGINPPRTVLYRMIDERLDARFAGIINEVKALLKEGIASVRLYALGLEYRFVCRMLVEELDQAQTLEKLKFAIHAFARRQLTWFRKMKGVEWVESAKEVTGALQ